MADESMVRNLAAQAEAIWPQEEPIFERHPPGSGDPRGYALWQVPVWTAAKQEEERR